MNSRCVGTAIGKTAESRCVRWLTFAYIATEGAPPKVRLVMDRNELIGRHFTDSAQRIVQHIAERALDRGMHEGELTEATAGMLAVLSILRWERKVGLAALERLWADLDQLARDLDDATRTEGRLSRDPGRSTYDVLPSGKRCLAIDTDTPRRRLLDQAEHEALGLGHDWVGTEHLLLAAVRVACPRFQQVLNRHSVSYDLIREAVQEVLHPNRSDA